MPSLQSTRFPILLPIVGGAIALVALGLNGKGAIAQIRPDATLPQPSQVQRQARPNQPDRLIIQQGTRAGANLFHSFQTFSVPADTIAVFAGLDPAIDRLFARVTGDAPSRINGTIELRQLDGRLSAADLFLLNDNGILFGEAAALNLGGSFLATTADRINFADGGFFPASPAPTLLTVSVPVGLQLSSRPAPIVNRSLSLLPAELRPQDPTGDRVVGLWLRPGRSLALVGGEISLPGGEVTVAGGRLRLGSLAGAGLVQLGADWRLEPSELDADALGTVRLSQQAELDISGTGGEIQILADRLAVTDGSLIRAYAGDRPGGALRIQANQLSVSNAASIRTIAFGSGRGGEIVVTAAQVNLQDSGDISTSTRSSGNGGRLRLSADQIAIDGSLVEGNRVFASGLNTQVATATATGNAGRLQVTTDRLTLSNGGAINSLTFGWGNAGPVQIVASQIDISGGVQQANRLFVANGVTFPSGIFTSAQPGSRGNGGALTVQSDRLQLRQGGVLQTATLSSGRAGNLRVQSTERVEVAGSDRDDRFPSSLNAASGGIPNVATAGVPSATGRGGLLQITTPLLRIGEGGAVAVGSLNPSDRAQGAGDLVIQAGLIDLDRQGQLLAETSAGNGGNLTLQTPVLLLRSNSSISTSAGTAARGGNGGNINLEAGFVLSTLPGNNDIRANAFTGSGGQVEITTQGIFGIAPQPDLTPSSDITASSEFGLSGTIDISRPEVDPSQGLVELPTNLIDATRQIAQICTIAPNRQSQFTVTGRGGVPASPSDPRSLDVVTTPWASIGPDPIDPNGSLETSSLETSPPETSPVASSAPATAPIVEAQSWQISNDRVVLVASGVGPERQRDRAIDPACGAAF